MKKICECLVKDQLNNNLLAEQQSAFREKHSCETVLNNLIADWKKCRENDDKIVVVFLDLKRHSKL